MTPEEEIARANDIAAQIAIAELLRVIIAEAFYVADRNEFKSRLRALEEATVSGITNRRLFPNANNAAEQYVKEAASGWITNIFASILHPGDNPNRPDGLKPKV
jgi:hypothetical protein